MKSVPVKSLAELAESVRYGYTASASDRPVGPHFLRITDIVPSQIDWDSVPFCEIDEKNRDRFSLAPGDIVIARTGATVGYAKLIRDNPEAVFASYLVRIRVDQEHADPGYVGRIVESGVYKKFVMSRVGGAAQPNANAKVLSAFRLPIPERVTQARIVEVLSAYDDLIENNRRRIQLLEQAARLLYKEWFVHLRFPGHEHVKITNGVPEGWESVAISTICTVGRGGSPRPIKDFLDGTIPWFKIGDATASESPFVYTTSEKIIEAGVKKSVFLPPRELILSNSATCGIPYFTGVTGCIHDGWLYFKNLRRVSKWFLYCCLHSKQRAILAGIGEGATQKNLNTDYIARQSLLLPKALTLLDHFTTVVEPLFEQVFSLAQANMGLREARDLLLPRLMSGEVAA